MSRTTYLAAIVLGLGVLAAVYFLHTSGPPGGAPAATLKFDLSSSTPGAPLGALPPLDATRTPPVGSTLYRSAKYRFSLFYPNTLAVKSYDEGTNSATIVFQNPQQGLGFQIFIVPYGYTQVQQDRFLKDEPAGVRLDPTDVSIDGVLGTAFYGKSMAIGTTSEVWFIKRGYLYEIVAPQSLATWLAGILATWQFI